MEAAAAAELSMEFAFRLAGVAPMGAGEIGCVGERLVGDASDAGGELDLRCSNTAIVARTPLRWNADCSSPRSRLEASSSAPVSSASCGSLVSLSCDWLRVREKRGFGFGALVFHFPFSLGPAAARGASRSVGVNEAVSRAGAARDAGGVAGTRPGFSTLVVGSSLASCSSLACASPTIDCVKKVLRWEHSLNAYLQNTRRINLYFWKALFCKDCRKCG